MQLKVNIARKQPMLDAATGKSVWGSLGKDEAPPSPSLQLRPSCSLYIFELPKGPKVRGFT